MPRAIVHRDTHVAAIPGQGLKASAPASEIGDIARKVGGVVVVAVAAAVGELHVKAQQQDISGGVSVNRQVYRLEPAIAPAVDPTGAGAQSFAVGDVDVLEPVALRRVEVRRDVLRFFDARFFFVGGEVVSVGFPPASVAGVDGDERRAEGIGGIDGDDGDAGGVDSGRIVTEE